MSKKDNSSPNNIRIRTRPTRSGFLLMLVLTAMLTASINYGNNMAFILTFLLLSLLMVSLLHTRHNLKGLTIANLMPQPVFAGEMLHINLELHNHSNGKRYGIWLAYSDENVAADLSGPYSIEAGSNATAQLSFPASQRGLFTLSHVLLVTVYPLGLFLVRGELVVDRRYLVYPRPDGGKAWPEPTSHSEEYGEGSSLKGGDDFTGIRPWRPGEPMHHIDWKAVARGRPMGIKEFTGGGLAQLYFDFSLLEGMGTESRLSQMCKWVLEADEMGTQFGVKLPDAHIPFGSGSTHTLKCLEALAIYKHQR